MRGVEVDSVSGAIPETVFAMFQLTFAIITPALIIGGFAERTRFAGMLLFSILWLVVVYLPVAHWVWGPDGWLFERGFRDFAGGAVVHVNAGVAALVAALVIGNRTGLSEHGDAAAQPDDDGHRRVVAVGRLVRLQRRQRARGERRRRHGDARDAHRAPPPARRRG